MKSVDAIVAGLADQGHLIWMDRKGIVGSETWRAKIVEAMEGCLAVIFGWVTSNEIQNFCICWQHTDASAFLC